MNIDYSQIKTAATREAEAFSKLLGETDKEIERWLDTTAKQENYRSIESCISYRGDPVPRFAAQAEAAFSWRSAVYAAATLLLKNPPPGISSPAQVIAMLPQPEEFGWFEVPEVDPLNQLEQMPLFAES